MVEIFRGEDHRRREALGDRRGHGHAGEDRGVRAHGPPVRPDRDGAHGRDRDLPRARRDLDAASNAITDEPRRSIADSYPVRRGCDHSRRRPGAAGALPGRGAAGAEGRPPGAARLARSALDSVLDPSAVVFASRGRGRGRGSASSSPIATASRWPRSGRVARLSASGADRFAAVARAWRELAGGAVADPPDGPPGAGLVALGGFAFAPDGRLQRRTGPASTPPTWSSRRSRWRAAASDVRLTLAALAAPDDVARGARRAPRRAAAGLRRRRRCRCSIPRPAGRFRDRLASRRPSTTRPPSPAAVERIRAGELEKIVLAREVAGPRAGAARRRPPCSACCARASRPATCSAPGAATRAFVAASPELLIRRDGPARQTVALAGSTRRSRRPGRRRPPRRAALRSDKDREEQAIVVRRIARALRPHAVWVAAPEEPAIIKVANIQHLATPIRAQLAHPLGAIELAGLLHPTPAVGGEPHGAAAPLIPALEGLDRGWYAGAVGWTDANDDGEFCVALRCALLRGDEARLLRGRGRRARLRPGRRARRDRDQARRAAAGPRGLGAR